MLMAWNCPFLQKGRRGERGTMGLRGLQGPVVSLERVSDMTSAHVTLKTFLASPLPGR